MKTLTGYKSLLLAGGLLFISLSGVRLYSSICSAGMKTAVPGKTMVTNACRIAPGGGSYIKDLAGKLFPVLKSLNIM